MGLGRRVVSLAVGTGGGGGGRDDGGGGRGGGGREGGDGLGDTNTLSKRGSGSGGGEGIGGLGPLGRWSGRGVGLVEEDDLVFLVFLLLVRHVERSVWPSDLVIRRRNGSENARRGSYRSS